MNKLILFGYSTENDKYKMIKEKRRTKKELEEIGKRFKRLYKENIYFYYKFKD